MHRYKLDDLGWRAFEELVQSLLQHKLGPGIQSWGPRGDYGRDAYFEGKLNFPANDIESEGPFIFQVKFVENANSAGANPSKAIQSAVLKEAHRISKRKLSGQWEDPSYYVLITNSPLQGNVRKYISRSIEKICPKTICIPLGYNDVCNYLDDAEAIRKHWYHVLGTRDIESLVINAVNNRVVQQSKFALAEAERLSRLFVQTQSYEKAREVLNKFNFCVLEGPPEMGKTAIANIIGLQKFQDGWQFIFCDSPDDFFSIRDDNLKQIFIADDAFGRTEYDPERSASWQRHLDYVFHAIDGSHWLIWTSRKHLLEIALSEMDLRGEARVFPSPGAVTVDASQLLLDEKALIYYVHAKRSTNQLGKRRILKTYARRIVRHESFTPERIRRFVEEVLPELDENLSGDQLSELIHQAIHTPTQRMRLAFQHLPDSHKWLLISILDQESNKSKDNVQGVYEKLCPDKSMGNFDAVVNHLSEAFLILNFQRLDWIHPSYRDLVIEELASDPQLSARYLRLANRWFHLAFSRAGGAAGARDYPLIQTVANWRVVEERLIQDIESYSKKQISSLYVSLPLQEEDNLPKHVELDNILEAILRRIKNL